MPSLEYLTLSTHSWLWMNSDEIVDTRTIYLFCHKSPSQTAGNYKCMSTVGTPGVGVGAILPGHVETFEDQVGHGRCAIVGWLFLLQLPMGARYAIYFFSVHPQARWWQSLPSKFLQDVLCIFNFHRKSLSLSFDIVEGLRANLFWLDLDFNMSNLWFFEVKCTILGICICWLEFHGFCAQNMSHWSCHPRNNVQQLWSVGRNIDNRWIWYW